MDLSKSDIDSMQSSHHVWETLEVTLLIGKPPLIGQGEIQSSSLACFCSITGSLLYADILVQSRLCL